MVPLSWGLVAFGAAGTQFIAERWLRLGMGMSMDTKLFAHIA